jgi:cell wall hydrolase
MEAQLAQSGSRVAWTPAFLSGAILLIFLVTLGLLLSGKANLNQSYEQLCYVLLGTLAAMVTQVGNFWLGSSKGSIDKQQDLNRAMDQLTNSVPFSSLQQMGRSGVIRPFVDARPADRPQSDRSADAGSPAARTVVTPIVPSATLDVLARTVWGEARGEGRPGMEAVACVIRNRALHPRWWGDDIPSVCRHPWQFSCWNANDPNLPKLRTVDASDPTFAQALTVARAAATGQLLDPTGGADSYYAEGIPAPAWAARATFTKQIGRHLFFRMEVPDSQGLPSAPTIAARNPDTSADELNGRELTDLTADQHRQAA